MPKSGLKHIDVGPELTKSEWESEDSHELIHGTSFPASPVERQLFYRDDEHKWYIYNGTEWVWLGGGSGGGMEVHGNEYHDPDFASEAALASHAAAATGVHGVGASYVALAPAASHLVRLFTKGWTSGKLLIGAGVDANPAEVAPNLYIPGANSSLILQQDGSSSSPFSAQINGTPTATSVVYDTDANENFLGSMSWAAQTPTKIILWNTTRGTSRVVTGINVATNTITTESSADSWADNDNITTQSQTNTTAGWCDIDVSAYLTANSVGIAFTGQILNTVAGTYYMGWHPFEQYSAAKAINTITNTANAWINFFFIVPVLSGKICIAIAASGAATFSSRMKYLGRIGSQ